MKFLKKAFWLLLVGAAITYAILAPQSAITLAQAIWTWLFVMVTAVTLHEWGHFYAMRLSGVKVVQFGIGMGKELFGRTDKHGTRWSICAFPIGGFVRPLSEKDSSTLRLITDENKHQTMEAAKLWKRMIIVSAGVIMNVITAYVVSTGHAYIYGTVEAVNPGVHEVIANTPAERAGLKAGDAIIEVNGHPIRTMKDMHIALVLNGREPSTITLENEGTIRQVSILPDMAKDGRPVMGFTPTYEIVRKDLNFFASLSHGVKETYYFTEITIISLGKLVTGKLGMETMTGPVGIAKVTGEAYENAGMNGLFKLLVIISISLAIMNSLPILPLDGGHFFMMLIEGIKSSPVPDAIQGAYAKVGTALVVTLVISVTFFDIGKIFG